MGDLRAFLQEALGRAPDTEILDYLKQRGRSELLSEGVRGKNDLIAEYTELEARFGSGAPAVIEIPGDARCRALSRILALEADRMEDVVRFRRERLKGKPLAPDQVVAWFKGKAKPAKTEESSRSQKSKKAGAAEAPDAGHLSFFDPVSGKTLTVGFAEGSALEELKGIAAGLCHLYQVWEEARTVTYVLDGEAPAIPLARVELRKNPLWPAASRAYLVIDPVTLPQLPYKILYSMRREVLPKGSKRTKQLSAKHLELAVKAEEKRGKPDRPWDSMMEEWNNDHPEWPYSSASALVQFSRDCRAAWTRVTGREWE